MDKTSLKYVALISKKAWNSFSFIMMFLLKPIYTGHLQIGTFAMSEYQGAADCCISS